MAKVTEQFYDDSSVELGLSHSWNIDDNPLLCDSAWNEAFNQRERERLEQAGEPLPPKVLVDGTIEDRDLDQQVKDELDKIEQERPDLNFPSQLALAKDRVSAKQRQTHRNQGAYDDQRKALKRFTEVRPDLTLVERTRLAREAQEPSEETEEYRPENRPDGIELGASVYSLMAHPFSGKHGGSRNRRRRQDRQFKFICRNCHLEFCEHRPKRRG